MSVHWLFDVAFFIGTESKPDLERPRSRLIIAWDLQAWCLELADIVEQHIKVFTMPEYYSPNTMNPAQLEKMFVSTSFCSFQRNTRHDHSQVFHLLSLQHMHL